MQKFYSAAKLTEAAIEAFDSGKPMNPAGVRGWMTSFTYQETDAPYNGRNVLLGDRIRSVSAPEYIHNVNLALEQGLNVDAATARAMGIQLYVIIKGKRDVTIAAKTASNEAQEASTKEATQVQGFVTTEAESSQKEPEANVSPEDETSPVVSNDEQQSNTEVAQGKETEAVDWDYAKSLKNLDNPKKQLETYAKKFGVELDRRKPFDAMFLHFENQLK